MKKQFQQLLQFHERFDCHVEHAPTPKLPAGVGEVRVRLMQEELDEYRAALQAGDMVEIADAIWWRSPTSNGPDFVVSGVGASLLGFKGMAGLALSYAWGVDQLILLMAACANGLKLFTEIDLAGRRRMFWGILATIVLTLGSVIGLTLYLAYEHGAINLSSFYFSNVAQYPYNFMSKNIQSPQGPSPGMWLHTGLGAAIMGGLMWLQYRFVWWPFHPLGFPISCVFGTMWFSVFVAWAIKGTVLKYGGLGFFERLKPFFLGLILGEAVVAGFWVVVDFCTGMQSNRLGNIVMG